MKQKLKPDLNKLDAMFNDAAKVVVQHQSGSTSLIQRKLSLGYNRAGSIIDQLEAAGIVGQFEGSKARKVLIKDEISLQEALKNLNNEATNFIIMILIALNSTIFAQNQIAELILNRLSEKTLNHITISKLSLNF